MHDHDIYDNTPSSYLDDIADIGEKHIRLSYPNFILLLARLDTDYNYAQYLVRCLYAKHLADELRHPNISGYLEEQDELSDALRHFRVTIPGIIARRAQLTELLKTRTVQVPAYVGDPWEYHPNAPEPDQPTFDPAAPHSDIEVRLQIIDEYLWLYEKYSSNK